MGADWSDNARLRKLTRQAPAATDVPSGTPARKDTKKWCGGKPGREHTPAAFPYKRYGTEVPNVWELCCSRCGKSLDFWWGNIRSWRKTQPKPAWVP